MYYYCTNHFYTINSHSFTTAQLSGLGTWYGISSIFGDFLAGLAKVLVLIRLSAKYHAMLTLYVGAKPSTKNSVTLVGNFYTMPNRGPKVAQLPTAGGAAKGVVISLPKSLSISRFICVQYIANHQIAYLPQIIQVCK